jgi:hypothetical protein
MPGYHSANTESALSRKACTVAAALLRGALNPTILQSGKTFFQEEKLSLVARVNEQFQKQSIADTYTVRKLDYWISNTRYKLRSKQKKRAGSSGDGRQAKRRGQWEKWEPPPIAPTSNAAGEAGADLFTPRCVHPVDLPAFAPVVGVAVVSDDGGVEEEEEEEDGGQAEEWSRAENAGISSFLCPISQEVMRDPVTAVDGHSYERKNIERWLRHKHTSPLTGEPLAALMLIPNHALRNSIREVIDQKAGGRGCGPDLPVQDGHYFVQGVAARASDTPESRRELQSCAAAAAAEEAAAAAEQAVVSVAAQVKAESDAVGAPHPGTSRIGGAGRGGDPRGGEEPSGTVSTNDPSNSNDPSSSCEVATHMAAMMMGTEVVLSPPPNARDMTSLDWMLQQLPELASGGEHLLSADYGSPSSSPSSSISSSNTDAVQVAPSSLEGVPSPGSPSLAQIQSWAGVDFPRMTP